MNARKIFLEMITAQGKLDECDPDELIAVDVNIIQSKLAEAFDTKKEQAIRNSVKSALENMYMFGGMPKPDPKYDSYMESMIDVVMSEIKK